MTVFHTIRGGAGPHVHDIERPSLTHLAVADEGEVLSVETYDPLTGCPGCDVILNRR